MNRVAFLDRDGVLNKDLGYVFTPEQFEWMPGAQEAVRWLNHEGFVVAVATNQSGIGRGLYSVDDFLQLFEWMQFELAKWGAKIDAMYYCPHHIDAAIEQFRLDCECRKPKPGMLLQGIREFDAEPDRCFFLGDKPSDLAAANAAGVRGILYEGGNLLDTVRLAALTVR